MTIISISILSIINVNAKSTRFYEGEYIDGIYMNKYQYSNNTIYYQKARLFRNSENNDFAYCIEPFRFFTDGSIYEETINPSNLSNDQKDRIAKIAHFGYGYSNHTDIKWYAVTQMMIWQVAGGNTGDFYFSNTLNGPKTDNFRAEINEINDLVDKYNIAPSFVNNTYNIVLGQTLNLKDNNNVLNYYKVSNNIEKNNDTVTFKGNTKGEYEFTLTREENSFNRPTIFYQSNNSQNIMQTGNLDNKTYKFKIKVHNPTITIVKIDKDTQSIITSGEASLDGAIFKLYDSNKVEIQELEIKNNLVSIDKLNFGKYYIQEITPGTGYNLDNELYEIELTDKKPDIELIIQNEVIKKKITIKKMYGETNRFQSEKNIDFEVYNNRNELLKTISTDELGQVEITLPYGTYKFVQINSTEGYNKVEPFYITINDNEDELIELKDYKIPVPDTHKNKNINILNLLLYLLLNTL